MARPKKPKYEYVEKLKCYRKRIKNQHGKYVAVYGKTVRELEINIAEFRRSLENCPPPDDPMVNDYIERWFALNMGGVSRQTKADYRRTINNHILPYTEGLRMREVKPSHITEWMSNVVDKSESVHNKTYMLLKRIFTSAFDNGVIAENPCPRMHNGGKEPMEKEALTEDQMKVLQDAVKGTQAYVFCMIGLYAGLRTEEILGLKWDCVFLDTTPRIEVKRAIRHFNNRPTIGEDLKTEAGRRTVPIPDQLVECLAEEKKKSLSEFVVHDTANGPLTKSEMQKLWRCVERRKVGKRVYYRYVDGKKQEHTVNAKKGEVAKHGGFTYIIDFDVTPHILRHTYITNLILGGVDVKTVQYLAGHAKSKESVDTYTHLIYNNPEELERRVNRK